MENLKTNELPNIELIDMPECGAYGPDYIQQCYNEQDIRDEYWKAIPDQFLKPQAKGSLFVSNLGRFYCSGFTYSTHTIKDSIYPARFNKIYYKTTKNRYTTSVHQLFNNNKKLVEVHLLLAIAFMNHVPGGQAIVVDHIDNDSSNNRLENLQLITQRENSSKDRGNGKTPYTGVYIQTRTKKIYSQIFYTNIGVVNIGSYPTERQAGMAYLAAIEYGKHHPGKHFNKRYIKFINDTVDKIVASFNDFESQAGDYLEYPAKKEFDFNTITPDFSILTKRIVRKSKPKKEKHLSLDELARNLFGNK